MSLAKPLYLVLVEGLMRFSQLKKLVEDLWVPELDLKLQCSSYRREGGPPLGRYWITFRGRTLWQAPSEFREMLEERTLDDAAPRVTSLLREYIDTPKEELMTKQFDDDEWELVDLLRAADRRVGKKRLEELAQRTTSSAVREVVKLRSEAKRSS